MGFLVLLALCCRVAVSHSAIPQHGLQDPDLSAERDALMELFGSTQPGSSPDTCLSVLDESEPTFMTGADRPGGCDGGAWKKISGWGSNHGVGSWFGVTTDTSGRVIKLDLNHNELVGPLSDLSALTVLKELDLRGNNLMGSIPESIGSLTALTELYLSANSFTGSIPESVGDLVNLTQLHISYAGITGPLPQSIGKLKQLNRIDLSENQITGKIPKSLRNLTKLDVLYLNHNPAKFKEKVIRNMLPKCKWVNV